jgi:hypothetical protein
MCVRGVPSKTAFRFRRPAKYTLPDRRRQRQKLQTSFLSSCSQGRSIYWVKTAGNTEDLPLTGPLKCAMMRGIVSMSISLW